MNILAVCKSKEYTWEKSDEILKVLKEFGNKVNIKLMQKLENDVSGKFTYIISDIKK